MLTCVFREVLSGREFTVAEDGTVTGARCIISTRGDRTMLIVDLDAPSESEPLVANFPLWRRQLDAGEVEMPAEGLVFLYAARRCDIDIDAQLAAMLDRPPAS